MRLEEIWTFLIESILCIGKNLEKKISIRDASSLHQSRALSQRSHAYPHSIMRHESASGMSAGASGILACDFF